MKIEYRSVEFGADPEFFFSKKGKILGAEKVLPPEGISESIFTHYDSGGCEVYRQDPRVIIDGVQGEFNVKPQTCRQTFSASIAHCFKLLAPTLKKHGVEMDFSVNIQVAQKELESLGPKAQTLGCDPSANVYGEESIPEDRDFFARGAGGHIHIGTAGSTKTMALLRNTDLLVPLLDLLVGNTCVMLDRNPGNKERRKVYGRAGEHRSPKHGLEYRTLSNFWLKHYVVLSLVLALVRFAVNVSADKTLSRKLLQAVPPRDVRRAINENDFILASKNFDAIKDIIRNVHCTMPRDSVYPLQNSRIEAFEHLAKVGLDHYFKKDPYEFWVKHDWHGQSGWEDFADRTLAADMQNHTGKLVAA